MSQVAAIAFLQVMAVTTKRHANYKTPAECAYDLCECFNLYTSSVSNTQSNSDAVFGFVRPCSCPGITEAFLCGEKRLECRADNHPSSVETKNDWRFTPTPSCAFIQGDSFGTRHKKMRISQRLFIRFWTCVYDYIPCFMRSMAILHEMLEMFATTVQAELNATLHVCESGLQDVLNNRSNFTTNVVFQFLYGAWLVGISFSF